MSWVEGRVMPLSGPPPDWGVALHDLGKERSAGLEDGTKRESCFQRVSSHFEVIYMSKDKPVRWDDGAEIAYLADTIHETN